MTPTDDYDVALLDLDGVVYIGGVAVPGAPEALQSATAAGMRLAYVTNNAFRTPAAVADLLTGMGAPATPADVVTSAQAAARLIAGKFPVGTKVLVIGGTGLRLALRERGLIPVSSASERPEAVVEGFAPGTSYSAIAEGGLAVAAGALFVATNGDSTLPGPRGAQPGNGSMVQAIAHATGVEPIVAGKPEPPLHHESVLRTGAKHPLVVGDRLDTDIEGAQGVGADSLLVLTGVTHPADVIAAPPHQRPTFIGADLSALLTSYIFPVRRGEVFQCADWTVGLSGQSLTLSGTGDPICALRALCAAAWASAEPVNAVAALKDLTFPG